MKLALDRGMSRRHLVQNQYLAGKYSNGRGGNIRAPELRGTRANAAENSHC
jgi:hypothetical protein